MTLLIVPQRRPLEGPTEHPWFIYPTNQPEQQRFAQQHSWRSRQTVEPFLDNIASETPPTVTTGLDWVQTVVDISWSF